LETSIDKNTKEFYQVCVEKFMGLAEKTEYKEWYLKKAEKYLKKCRM
jgi:hypothetical protein